MAERTIGLRININGTQQVITQIDQLEQLLTKAKEDLKQVEIGSSAFKKLSQEISLAEGQLESLNQQARSLTPERQVEGYSKLAGGITSSFAAATAAVQLFGNESEEVTKATIQAQNLLTLALSARGIAELKTGVQIVANTIATKAAAAAANLETAATTRLTVATRAFYTTLAANPYGAILAVVGLLVTALVAFSSETEEAEEKQKTLLETQQEAIKATVTETQKIEILTDIIKDSNASLDAREGAYQKLAKIIPELAGYTLQEAEAQGLLNVAIERELELINLRARAKALEDFITEQEKERIATMLANEEREKAAALLQQQSDDLKEAQQIMKGMGAATMEEAFAQVERNKQLRESLSNLNGVQQVEKKRGVLQQELFDINTKILELEKQRNDEIEKSKNRTDALNKSEEERKKQTQALIDLLGQQARVQAQLLTQALELEQRNVDIVGTLEENVATAKKYEQALNKLKTTSELFAELQADLTPKVDKVGQVFDKVRDKSEEYFDSIKEGKLSTEQLLAAGQKLKEEALSLGKAAGLTKNDLDLLEKYVLNYTQFTDAVNKFQNTSIIPPFDAATFEKDLIDVQLLTGKIKIDPYSQLDPSSPNYRDPAKLQADLLNAQERLQKDQEAFIKSYVELRKQEVDLTKFSKEEQEKLVKTYEEAGKIAFNNLVNVGNEVIQFEYGVVAVSKQVETLNQQLANLAPAARRGFIVENTEQIAEEYSSVLDGIAETDEELYDLKEKLRKKDYTEEERYSASLTSLRKNLAKEGINIDDLSYEEQLRLLEAFLKKEIDLTKDAEKKKQDARNETLDGIRNVITEITQLATEVASVGREAISFQLENLERRYQASLEMVVGDTKQANDKRIELEKQYNEEKKAIEKKAALTELSLSLVQATANVAEAITKALTTGIPLVSQIAAGISAAIGAVQVGVIASQIQSVNSLRRGGILSSGGITRGASHEQGGIRFGQAGLELEGNEAVINRNSTLNYGGLLSSINQSGGGRPLVVSSPMDSRLMEVLAKERQTPIRAYVVEQDISRAQTVTKRLEQLSTF